MFRTFFCILFTFIVIVNNTIDGVVIFRPLKPSESYTHTLIVNDDMPTQYVIFWKLINNSEEIQFEVHCRTTGWVGLGFSPNGGMVGSDVVIGWVKDGQAYLRDCYAASKTAPRIDAQQDYTLLEGTEIEGYTILKFSRKLVTCDVLNDMEIKVGSQFMIFAWNSADPLTGTNDWIYHGASNRFPKTTLLLSYKDEDIEEQGILPPDVFAAPLRFSNLLIPPRSTYYYCDIFALPTFTKPVHFIQYEMIVNPLYKKNVHHLLAYECDDDYVLTTPLTRECGIKGVPGTVGRKCMQKMILAWGIGGPLNYTFPKNTGYRFEANGRPKYILIEIHYDNPQLLSNILDDSGVKFYFTEQLREQNLGLLRLGTDGSSLSLQIPPKSKDFAMSSICNPSCTQRYIPVDGITVFSGFLHTHLAGRAVKTTLVQNGIATRELFENPNYDFNYQFHIDIEPIKLNRGDALITQCRYETNDRSNFTFFGFSTYDEMCFDFVYYYPKIPSFQICLSQEPDIIIGAFYQSLMDEGLVPTAPLTLGITTEADVINFFQNFVVPSKTLTERFEAFYVSSYNKTYICGDEFQALVQYNAPHYAPIRNDINIGNSCSKQ